MLRSWRSSMASILQGDVHAMLWPKTSLNVGSLRLRTWSVLKAPKNVFCNVLPSVAQPQTQDRVYIAGSISGSYQRFYDTLCEGVSFSTELIFDVQLLIPNMIKCGHFRLTDFTTPHRPDTAISGRLRARSSLRGVDVDKAVHALLCSPGVMASLLAFARVAQFVGYGSRPPGHGDPRPINLSWALSSAIESIWSDVPKWA